MSISFFQREHLLQTKFMELSISDFYDLIFHGLADRIMLVEAGKRYFTEELEKAVEFGYGRSDVYFCPVEFWDGYKKDRYVNNVFAMVVDIDGLSAFSLEMLLRPGRIPTPTLIVNTGGGVHCYYIFDKPISTFPTGKEKVARLYKALHLIFPVATDRHSIGQAFRMVGGNTKQGNPVRAYLTGDLWQYETLESIVNAFGKRYESDSRPPRIDSLPVSEIAPQVEKKQFKAAQIRGQSVYLSYLNKARIYSQVGFRYKSMMALTVIASKQNISKKQLAADLGSLAKEWAARDGTPMKDAAVADALRMYGKKYVRTKWSTLHEWLGWNVGRNREQWIKQLNSSRQKNSLDAIMEFMRQHPGCKKIEIHRATGLSRVTIDKYYSRAKSLLEKNN